MSLVQRVCSVLFLTIGLIAQTVGAEVCHPTTYLARRPDVQAAGMNPYDHFIQYGYLENMCQPSSTYHCSSAEYLQIRPDVAAAGMSPLDHYTSYGRFEGMCTPDPEVPAYNDNWYQGG